MYYYIASSLFVFTQLGKSIPVRCLLRLLLFLFLFLFGNLMDYSTVTCKRCNKLTKLLRRTDSVVIDVASLIRARAKGYIDSVS